MVRRVWLEQAGTGLSLNKHRSDQLPFISPECGHMPWVVTNVCLAPVGGPMD